MTDQLTLYAIPISAYCSKVRIALRHKGLEWRELPPPGGYGSDEYKKIVPSGNLPALVIGDHLLADSEAINEFIEEAYPELPLLSEDLFQRSKQRERGRFHDTRLEPAQRAIYSQLRSEEPDLVFLETQSQQISKRLSQLDRMLGSPNDWQFSLGDCGYPGTFAWLDAITPVLRLKFTWPESVISYRKWIESQEAVAAELAILKPAILSWLSN